MLLFPLTFRKRWPLGQERRSRPICILVCASGTNSGLSCNWISILDQSLDSHQQPCIDFLSTMTTSTRSLGLEPPTLTIPKPDTEHDFFLSQLRPAPLRLSRKSQSDTGSHDSQTENSINSAYTRDSNKNNDQETPNQQKPNCSPKKSPTQCRRPAPSLASIVSRYEVLDAISQVDVRTFAHPLSPARHHGAQTPVRMVLTPPQRDSLSEESPFRQFPRLMIPLPPRTDCKSSSEYCAPMSPNTLRTNLRPGALKGLEASPLKDRTALSLSDNTGSGQKRGHVEH